MHVCVLCLSSSWESQIENLTLGTGVTDGCEAPPGLLGVDLGPL